VKRHSYDIKGPGRRGGDLKKREGETILQGPHKRTGGGLANPGDGKRGKGLKRGYFLEN